MGNYQGISQTIWNIWREPVIRYVLAAMRPFAASTAATCYNYAATFSATVVATVAVTVATPVHLPK